MAGVRRATSWAQMAVVGIAALAMAGCATLSGEWKADPSADEGGMSRLSTVSFDRGGRFTASGRFDKDARTLTGRYRWNGKTLTLAPDGDEAQRLPCHMRWDGVLVLRFPVDDSTKTIQLRRQKSGVR